MQAVAQGKALEPGGIALQADAVHGRGVDVVDHPGVRAERLDVAGAFQDDGELAHSAEDAARPDGVAGAHADAVFYRDVAVDAPKVDRPVGKAEHHKVGPAQHVPAPGGRLQRQVHSGVGDHHLCQPGQFLDPFLVGIDEGQRAFVQVWGVDHLPDGLPAEEQAARADDDYFGMLCLGHCVSFPTFVVLLASMR